MGASPFNLKDNETYLRWRDKKLSNYPQKIEELLVEINDPRRLKKKSLKLCLSVARKLTWLYILAKQGQILTQKYLFRLDDVLGFVD